MPPPRRSVRATGGVRAGSRLFVPLILGVWTAFFCFFRSRQQQQQQQQQQQALQLNAEHQYQSWPVPIGPRILEQQQSPATEPDDWPAVYKDFEHDTQCLRQGEGQVFFLHMRKAGGSNMRDLLVQVSEALPKKSRKSSFRFVLVEGPTMNVSCFDERSRVFVTTLRDPIDRILSSYHYEGAYQRYDPRMYHTDADVKLFEETFALQKNRRTLRDSPLGFREWVEQTRRAYYQDETPSYRRENVWVSVDNYYIKTLVNRHRADTTVPVTRADLELAKHILANIDIVLITEWLNDADQTAHFARRLGLDEAALGFNITFGSKKKRKHPPRLHPERDEETLALLRSLNALDIELYDFAKKLVRNRIDQTLSARPPNVDGDAVARRPCKPPPPRKGRRGPPCLLPASWEEDLYFGGITKFNEQGEP